MKRLMFSIVFLIGVSGVSLAQEVVEKKSPPLGNALVGDYYGVEVSNNSVGTAISVEKLETGFNGRKKMKNVVVKGVVEDVCEKRGCWVTLKTENGSSFFVKMRDYAFFVPTALRGKNVVLEGDAERKITSVDELKHYAKDAKKTQNEIDAITSSKEEIGFLASGIKVVK